MQRSCQSQRRIRAHRVRPHRASHALRSASWPRRLAPRPSGHGVRDSSTRSYRSTNGRCRSRTAASIGRRFARIRPVQGGVMPTHTVQLQFITGLKRAIFRNGRVLGSWDANGRFSQTWSEAPMQEGVAVDGCPMFSASVTLDTADQDRTFTWGVVLDGPQGANFWGIPTEVKDVNSADRYRQFRLAVGGPLPQLERYYFTYCRRLGANKQFSPGSATPGIRFAVWAPNAGSVQVVFASPNNGYVFDDGTGIDPAMPVITLARQADDTWEGAPAGNFESFMSFPY